MRTILVLALAAVAVAYPSGFGFNYIGWNGPGWSGAELNGAGLNGVGLTGIGLPVCGINGVHNNVAFGPTVSESVVTPFHRTDAISGPVSRTVVQTSAVPAATNLGLGSGYNSGAPFLSPGGVGCLGTAGLTGSVLGDGLLAGAGGALGTGVGGVGIAGGVCAGGWGGPIIA